MHLLGLICKRSLLFLNRSYPFYYKEFKHNIFISVIAAFFVIMFVAMQPQLAIKMIETSYFRAIIAFTTITIVTSQVFMGIGPILLKKWCESWKIYKEICFALCCIFTMGVLNYAYVLFFGKEQFRINQFNVVEFLQIVSMTIFSGLIPLAIVIMINNLKFNKKIEERPIPETKNNNEKENPLTIELEKKGAKYSVEIGKIHLVESMGNYLKVYINKDEDINVLMTRSTTKEFETLLINNANFFRTHRSYIINCDKIDNVSGNISNGLEVLLLEIDFRVPVSRSKAKQFQSLLNYSGN